MAGLQKVLPARLCATASLTTALLRRYSQFLPLKQTLAKENRGFVEKVDFPGKTLLGPPTGEKVTSVNRATPPTHPPRRFPPCRS